ncbi:hypothetical protein [Comamonas serinivorans]|uniref:hypothetical protein n=1 Tax=Comamonas serinivorans TaxID=1082851 RepID=UPI0012FB0FD8|nr:hypothetical protein [Comamonas serinivorans]
MKRIATVAALMGLVLSGAALAEDAQNSDLVFPNSPQKPDAGEFNPVGTPIKVRPKRVVIPPPIPFPEPPRVHRERQPVMWVTEPMSPAPAPRTRRADRN